ncbi:MAG TPA: hypothetical protein VHE82_09655 [Gemmatimonadaceae bacterium]|nr:hypothetical protein [Gemmatimonadaceae bacterium]
MRSSKEMIRRELSRAIGLFSTLVLAVAAQPSSAAAQWSKAYEQFYMPGDFNWTFRRTYPAADRLFNAFDYGHAILYEKLYTRPGADVSLLEDKEYNFITKKLLVSPPNLPLEEAAIEVAYAKIAPEAKIMFDWAHLFHRQVYDVLADEKLSQAEKDATIARLISYYKTRPDLAFSSSPKSMDLMEGQPYSLAFRNKYPKFNGLIWGYHWLQVGLYEPLMTGKTLEERQAGVTAAVARFRQMLENAPEHMPRIMPMTAAVAPTFAKRYPEAAIIFDNLHSMHDVVSDILANPKVPHDRKRAEILRAAAAYRDRTSYVITPGEWMEMAQMMGLENMGGPAVGILPGWPTPTIARGQSAAEAMKNMAGMSGVSGANPKMAGMKMDSSSAGSAGMAGMDHSKMPETSPSAASPSSAPMNHANMNMAKDSAGKSGSMNMTGMNMDQSAMMQMHMRMMKDPVIRERVMRDTTMRRLMNEMMQSMPADHEMNMSDMTPSGARRSAPSSSAKKDRSRAATSPKSRTTSMTKASTTNKAKSPTAKGTSSAEKKAAAKPAPKPTMPPMDHSKMKMPGMEMPPVKKN